MKEEKACPGCGTEELVLFRESSEEKTYACPRCDTIFGYFQVKNLWGKEPMWARSIITGEVVREAAEFLKEQDLIERKDHK